MQPPESVEAAAVARAGTATARMGSPVPAPTPEPPKAILAEPLPPPRDQAPTRPNGQAHPSVADTFERLLSAEDVEASFARLEQGAAVTHPATNVAPSDLAEVRSLFAQLAANHVRQVRDFMIDLRWSDATADWIAICEPALRSLRRAADKLELVGALHGARTRSARARRGAGDAARRPSTATLARDHPRALRGPARVMPQAFALDLDRTQREAVILQSLLLQVPEVKKVTARQDVRGGADDARGDAPRDRPATSRRRRGSPEALAEQHRRSASAAYREQVKATVPDATRARERERIAELTARLRREHDEYERASQSWTREAEEQKKELRKARAQTLLDIQVVLARLGEVERLARDRAAPVRSEARAARVVPRGGARQVRGAALTPLQEEEMPSMPELTADVVLRKIKSGEKVERADLRGLVMPKAVLEGVELPPLRSRRRELRRRAPLEGGLQEREPARGVPRRRGPAARRTSRAPTSKARTSRARSSSART